MIKGNAPLFFTVILLILLQACSAPEQEDLSTIQLNLNDKLVQKVMNFQDEQQLDSLYTYLQHEQANIRYLAARAFGSIREESAIGPLSSLLDDRHPDVRAIAAFAIGQTGAEKAVPALINGFNSTDTAGYYGLMNSYILEAVGKCGTEKELDQISSTTTYEPTDTLLLEGQAWGIYRFGLRSVYTDAGTERMFEFIKNDQYPTSVRMIAANYFYRSRGLDLAPYGDQIAQQIFKEDDARIRMALAIALGKSKTEEAEAALQQLLRIDNDYRVKTNVLRALGNFDYAAVKENVLTSLKDGNQHVANASASFFLEYGDAKDATEYWRLAKDSLDWQSSATMYAAAQRHLPAYYADYREALNGELRRRFRQSTNPYEQAAILSAMSEFGWNYRFIQREGFQSEHAAVRTASVQALADIINREDFDRYFGAGRRSARRELAIFLKDAIRSGDVGMIAVASGALKNLEYDYRDYLVRRDSTFLQDALLALDIPKEIETYNALQEAIAVFEGKEAPQVQTPEYQHPIEWNRLSGLKATPQATINTAKGTIKLQLLPEEAPGSVANFVALAKDKFFDGKNFHRVVPNFVVQGGCPRGDGYGGLAYTIRSELTPLHYDKAGYVGMASAGNHTEGTQFFITHSPTPHLDGNYTIFAQVVEGMDVVHQLGVGDVMESVSID